MVGTEHTVASQSVRVPLEGPQDAHLLDGRAIRRPEVVHCERAQCELEHYGPVVPIEYHRKDVPSVRFCGRHDLHLLNVNLRAIQGASQLPALCE